MQRRGTSTGGTQKPPPTTTAAPRSLPRRPTTTPTPAPTPVPGISLPGFFQTACGVLVKKM